MQRQKNVRSGGEKVLSRYVQNRVIVALGANTIGHWGTPADSLARCLSVLQSSGFSNLKVSPVYRTAAWGGVRQPDFLNLVVAGRCSLLPRQLIQLFKRLERQAGRRLLGRNAMRPLDIDLIDYKGRIVNAERSSHRPKLVLPHPLIAERPFVLIPLADLAAHWRHPVNGLIAEQMLHQLGGRHRFLLQKSITPVDSIQQTCDLKLL